MTPYNNKQITISNQIKPSDDV